MIDAVIYQDESAIGTSVGYVGLTPEEAERFPNQNRDLITFLEESLQVALGDAETRMATVSCDAETARRLGIEEGAAMLWLEDFLRDVEGRPRAIKQTRYRGDRVAFWAIARRRAATGPAARRSTPRDLHPPGPDTRRVGTPGGSELEEGVAQVLVGVAGAGEAAALERGHETLGDLGDVPATHPHGRRRDEEAVAADLLDDLAHRVGDVVGRADQLERPVRRRSVTSWRSVLPLPHWANLSSEPCSPFVVRRGSSASMSNCEKSMSVTDEMPASDCSM